MALIAAQLRQEFDDEGKLKVCHVRNLPLPGLLNAGKVKAAMDYMPEDGDIILCSYPKTGTTWMTYIIWHIINKGKSLEGVIDMKEKVVPQMEFNGPEPIKALQSPRFYLTHMPFNVMKINKKAKYVYVHRNPMDTLVSFYHFINSNDDFLKLSNVFNDFMSGEIFYGDYFEHVKSFYSHNDDQNIFIVAYEDLHKDKTEVVLKLAKFLGENYYQALVEDKAFLQKVLTVTEFNYMKQGGYFVTAERGGKIEKVNVGMFRKGIVGDAGNVLSVEQMALIKEKMLEK